MTRPRFAALLTLLLFPGGCGSEAPQGREAPAADAWPVVIKGGHERPAEYERVVLVTIDTLRADHVSCYGYPRPTTPFLDSLAAHGVRFTRAMASVSHTAPSHATILTGVVPAVHGVVQNGGTLDPAARDLGTLFGEAGFETAAFLNVKFLSGIAASFGHVGVEAVGGDGNARRKLSGADVVSAALGWLKEKRTNERFLLWVHLYDPHKWKDLVIEREGRPEPLWNGGGPSDLTDELLGLHGLGPAADRASYRVDWKVEQTTGRELEVQSLAGFLRCIDAYDEYTLFADRQVQRLYQGLEALGLPGRTLWVVTSDHGEGLASHGVAGHGGRIYQEQLHVPLVLHASDGSLGPRVVDELVSHVDLLPTLVETLGERATGIEPLFDGRSLWPLVRGGGSWPERALFAQRRPADGAEDPDTAEVYALQTARTKYILHEPGEDEFFDLASDPKELVNLGQEAPAAAGLRAALDARLKLFGSLAPKDGEDVPEEWTEELRALGYVR